MMGFLLCKLICKKCVFLSWLTEQLLYFCGNVGTFDATIIHFSKIPLGIMHLNQQDMPNIMRSCYLLLIYFASFGCIICLVCSAEDESESSGNVEEEKSNEQKGENQTEKPESLEPATFVSDLADKSDNEQDVSAMEVE